MARYADISLSIYYGYCRLAENLNSTIVPNDDKTKSNHICVIICVDVDMLPRLSSFRHLHLVAYVLR